MWQERADYGHFFYRIPNGESAADAYDRGSGFNESLWRSFGEDDFASVCVLVTHGLMTRVFLMKWYHFSVEYFEDLRNINHCEFVVMRLNPENGKYALQNQLRTWSDLKRERANSRTTTTEPTSPIPVRKKWGVCQDGESGDDFARRQRARRQNTADLFLNDTETEGQLEKEKKLQQRDTSQPSPTSKPTSKPSKNDIQNPNSSNEQPDGLTLPSPPPVQNHFFSDILQSGRDGGGSRSGATSPNRSDGSADSDTEHPQDSYLGKPASGEQSKNGVSKDQIKLSMPVRSSMAMALKGELDGKSNPSRHGRERVRADALGDQSDAEDEEEEEEEAAREREKAIEGQMS